MRTGLCRSNSEVEQRRQPQGADQDRDPDQRPPPLRPARSGQVGLGAVIPAAVIPSPPPAGSSRGHHSTQATSQAATTAVRVANARWVWAAKHAATASGQSARRWPSATSQARNTADSHGSSGTWGFHRLTATFGPRLWTSSATTVSVPTSSGHRPRRHATAAIPATAKALTAAAVHISARGSSPVSRWSGAASQNSSGPGWAQPFTVSAPTNGVARPPTWDTRYRMWAMSPAGYQVSPTSESAATTIGLTASATTAAAAGRDQRRGPAAGDRPGVRDWSTVTATASPSKSHPTLLNARHAPRAIRPAARPRACPPGRGPRPAASRLTPPGLRGRTASPRRVRPPPAAPGPATPPWRRRRCSRCRGR